MASNPVGLFETRDSMSTHLYLVLDPRIPRSPVPVILLHGGNSSVDNQQSTCMFLFVNLPYWRVWYPYGFLAHGIGILGHWNIVHLRISYTSIFPCNKNNIALRMWCRNKIVLHDDLHSFSAKSRLTLSQKPQSTFLAVNTVPLVSEPGMYKNISYSSRRCT